MTRKDFQSHLPRCWQCGWCFENETTKIVNYSRDFSLPFELPLSQCFGYPDQLCLRLFSSPLWANRNKREKFQLYNILCPPGGPTPFYRVLFRLKFPTASGHMITCLLMWVWFGSRSFSKDLVGHDPEPNIRDLTIRQRRRRRGTFLFPVTCCAWVDFWDGGVPSRADV